MSARQAGQRWECEACGEPLIGALGRSGRIAPITVAPYDDGNVLLHNRIDGSNRIVCSWVLAGDTLAKARENDVQLRRNHFMSCPHADRFRPHPKEDPHA